MTTVFYAAPSRLTSPEKPCLSERLSARNRRRRELRAVIRDRHLAVETLLQIKRGELRKTESAKAPSPTKAAEPTLKRYRNE